MKKGNSWKKRRPSVKKRPKLWKRKTKNIPLEKQPKPSNNSPKSSSPTQSINYSTFL